MTDEKKPPQEVAGPKLYAGVDVMVDRVEVAYLLVDAAGSRVIELLVVPGYFSERVVQDCIDQALGKPPGGVGVPGFLSGVGFDAGGLHASSVASYVFFCGPAGVCMHALALKFYAASHPRQPTPTKIAVLSGGVVLGAIDLHLVVAGLDANAEACARAAAQILSA